MVSLNKIAYCPHCKKEIKKPKRKKLDSFYYQVLIIATLSSLGLALLGWIIYRLFIQKKKYCSTCYREVRFYDNRSQLPGPRVPVINLLERMDDENKSESQVTEDLSSIEEKIACDNCGKLIEKNIQICPYCGKEQGIETEEII